MSLLAEPHHDGAAWHVPVEAPRLGDTVPVFVRVPHGHGTGGVWARATADAEPMFVAGRIDRTTAAETWWRCDIPMHNPLTGYRFLLGGGADPGYRWLNGSGTHHHDVTDADDFLLTTAPPAADWARDAIVYQIFPDRFARSGHDREPPPWAEPAGWDDPVVHTGPSTPAQWYGGDLDGVTDKLDHIGAVGADTVYLTPFFPAPSNHRYNASSFDEVDPHLGGDKALARLAQEVHARGWRILGDLTTNHCGSTHPWFRTALADPASLERQFFYLTPAGEVVGWLGHGSLPKLRYASVELRRRLVQGPASAAARWLRPPFELDGWRVDVANMTGRYRTDDRNAEVAAALRRTVDEARPGGLLIAEHCHDATADLRRGDWHGTMNYAGFSNPVWTWLRDPAAGLTLSGKPVAPTRGPAEALLATVRAFRAGVPWHAMAASWSLVGSHDTARIRTITGDAALVEVAAGLMFTMPGVPMVYAGDEIGLTGTNGEDARRPFPWDRPERWDRRTFDVYARLAALRRDAEPLRRGGLRWVHAHGDVLVFLRESAAGRLLVLAARSPHAPVRLLGRQLGLHGEAANRYGGAPPLRAAVDNHVTLPGDGPTFQVWQL
ncbi:alpha-glycosidase [Asanoa ishikariensis]|uniref:Alpha-glucosidase n=1 Tax=Asanoa ishikariensis TaxID=137265 RepID=A0A1H3UR39_9ACTN|nr:glycoside hydrolase family 13 protein [Asanoa ishikariensis]GIF69127.1 alpha-glycosidase [Asanoa ishikariensis]SDZ64229.1 alpha-glucosidase [Asanoa ishikariensis]